VKILVIRLSSLGDVVLTLPIVRLLRATYPDARISALVKSSFADAISGSSDISDRIILNSDESLVSLVQKIRSEKFDVILDLHANVRSRIVSFFSGAARVIRYRKAALARRLFVGWRIASPELARHTLDRYFDAAEELTGPSPDRPHSFLVIQTAFLGDAVLTTPMLAALRERFPSTRITVVATPEVADVFRQAAVDDVIIFDKRGREKSLAARWRLAKELRRRHFDWAIIPHRSMTSALLAFLARIPRRIGFDRSQGRWLLTHEVPFRWGTHDVDRNMGLLEPLGVKQAAGKLWLEAEPQTADAIKDRLRDEGISGEAPLIGINAGSAWATKRWLPEGFAAVADRLVRQSGAQIIFIGAPKDAPVIADIRMRMKEKAVDWTGKTNLKELIAVIRRCHVFLTNDSGPMHIAVAGGIPTVAIFGPTTKELGFFPYGPGHTVIEKSLPCRPCGLHGADRCPLEHFQCMRLITPEEVFAAVRSKLALKTPS
jgi:heptosyltransferase-2